MGSNESSVGDFLAELKERNPHEEEFHQAVEEVAQSVMDWYSGQKDLRKALVFERLTEPDRIISFRVSWENDEGGTSMNRAWRVQFNHVLGPYKGGLRFAPSVNQSVLKFLGFEQILKNSLTGLPMGGAKGGSNFDPKGKSRNEIMRFCQSFMSELYRHIGPDIDVPAGDIGVGADEISMLYGHYLRLSNTWHGALTGKGCAFGGSAVRTEATGYGCVYFCENMLAHHDRELDGMRVAISGSGNVSLYAAEKAIERGAKVISMSDSGGTIFVQDGLSPRLLKALKTHKEDRNGRLSEFAEGRKEVDYRDDEKPWSCECDIAMPCATQNELEEDDAETLADNGVIAVCEGANMPVTREAGSIFRDRGILHAPGKAANAGGVAVSGLEQSQNAIRQSWSAEDVDKRLKDIMKSIHEDCVENHEGDGQVNYVDSANLAGFKRVATAMHSFGVF